VAGTTQARPPSGKKFNQMTTDRELEGAARQIICTSTSVEEAKRRLREELGYPFHVSLHTDPLTDELGNETRELVRQLGGMIMANGTMVSGTIYGRDGSTIILL
jgi:hypothetical protein